MTTAVCDLYRDSMAACAHDDGVRKRGKPKFAREEARTVDTRENQQQLENKSRKRERLKRWVSRVWEGGD